ncbi:MAG: HD domain-containing protein [Actinobacteria bacterium]|nr:HD domain-containing protein [Cyanobacteriota bacterium]MCL5771025.1 HD domain-containing protein [Actinomycetota bacterium]
MLVNRPIPFLDLILSISEATDLIDSNINNHGKRVAYIALNIANELEINSSDKHSIVIAGLLHDIGAFSLQEKLKAANFEFEFKYNSNEINQHAEVGYMLLKKFKPLLKIAEIIRYHHYIYKEAKKLINVDKDVLLFSQIIHLADRIDILIKKDIEILKQVSNISDIITEYSGDYFNPDLVKLFNHLKEKEYFWLDTITSPHIQTFSRLLGYLPLDFSLDKILDFAKMFSYIIDFRSSFTATHSRGVTATSIKLAELNNFSNTECKMMEIAGYLHDLGKLSVPAEILEKPAKLNTDEFAIIRGHTYFTYKILSNVANLDIINTWASFHHECLDGKGYPFHLGEDDLSLGSRIMAVSDIFTAITEDRPYRKGMNKIESLKVLESMARNKKIDWNVVEILKLNYDEINSARMVAQKESLKEYKEFKQYYKTS